MNEKILNTDPVELLPPMPKGYYLTNLPEGFKGNVWLAEQVERYGRECAENPDPMSAVAHKYAHSMAMYLEMVLMSRNPNKWWNEAMGCLGKYRSEMNAIHERISPTFMGEPVFGRNQDVREPQEEPLRYDPATGEKIDTPITAQTYRLFLGVVAWLFNPWNGVKRDPRDIGSDVQGFLITPTADDVLPSRSDDSIEQGVAHV